jgi:hypothetical protein
METKRGMVEWRGIKGGKSGEEKERWRGQCGKVSVSIYGSSHASPAKLLNA